MAQSAAIVSAIKAISAELQETEAHAETLRTTLAALNGKGSRNAKGNRKGYGKTRNLSAKGRAAISRAAKKRWAAYNRAKAAKAK